MDDMKILSSGFGIFVVVQAVVIWTSIFIPSVIGFILITNFPILLTFPWFFLLIPLVIGLFFLTVFCSIFIAVIGLKLLYRKYPPREGSFDIDLSINETRGWMYRRNIKGLANVFRALIKIHALQVFMLRAFGLKIGKNVKLYGYVSDDPFIEIGDGSILGSRSIISGHLYDNYKITFNKTIIKKNVIFEPVSGAVGAILGDNCIIRGGAFPGNIGGGALRGQKTRGNGIFDGVPMRRVGDYSDLTSEEIEQIKKSIEEYSKRNVDKEKIAPIKISTLKLVLYKALIVIMGLLAGVGIGVLFYFTVFSFFYIQVGGFLGSFLTVILIPIFILMAVGFFLTFGAIAAKLLISTIPEGTYELDSKEARKWKFNYLLKKFLISLFHATIFDLADVFVLRYVYGNKIGKNVIVKEGLVDPEYLEIGNYANIPAQARVHTHNIIDGKLVLRKVKIGNKVMVGSVAHLDVGVEVGDGAIVAVATRIKVDAKLEPNALYLGTPNYVKFPKDLLKKVWIKPEKETL